MKSNYLIISIFAFLFYNTGALAENSIAKSIFSEDTISEVISIGDWHFYKIDIDNTSKLTVKLRKLSDDVDMYVSHTKLPTSNDFLCAPQKSGKSIETCRLKVLTPAIWYIGLYGKEKSDYQLSVKIDAVSLLTQR